MHYIDIHTWERREHFAFFHGLASPRLNVTFPLRVEALLACRHARGKRRRLSDCLYFAAATAANRVPEFQTRLYEGKPVTYDRIDMGFTYIPPGRTLHANCMAVYDPDFAAFSDNISAARALAEARPTLTLQGVSQNAIFSSILPGLFFSSFVNPWGDPHQDSVPRVICSKIESVNGSRTMNVSVETLHSFVDGRHLEQYRDVMQEMFNAPEVWLD